MPAPSLTAPADAATGVSLVPSLSWGAVSGASVYQVQISLHPDFASPVLDVEVASSPVDLRALIGSHAYPLDFGFGYYWRARAKVTGAWDAWSAARTFRVEEAVFPYTPILDHVATAQGLLLEQFKEKG